MRKLMFALAIGLSLGGCATIQGVTQGTQANPVTLDEVYTARSAYFISAGKAFEIYRGLPSCNKAPQPCRSGALMLRIQQVDRTVRRNLNTLEGYVRAHNTLGVAAVQDALRRALAEAKQIQTEYHLENL